MNIIQWTENQYLYQGKQSTLRISATTEQRITTAHYKRRKEIQKASAPRMFYTRIA